MITLAQGAESLQLPNPELQDLDQINTRTKLRRSMSGRVVTYVRTPISRRILMTFNMLSGDDIDNLKAFLAAIDETDITFTDWRADAHTGKLITEEFEVTTLRDGATCGQKAIRLEFQYE